MSISVRQFYISFYVDVMFFLKALAISYCIFIIIEQNFLAFIVGIIDYKMRFVLYTISKL